MDRGNVARQGYAHYLFSRIQASYLAYFKDEQKESQSIWWHTNLNVEMVDLPLINLSHLKDFVAPRSRTDWHHAYTRLELRGAAVD
jgi:hypothetical protein